MASNELLHVFIVIAVFVIFIKIIDQEIITYTRTNKGFFDFGMGINLLIN